MTYLVTPAINDLTKDLFALQIHSMAHIAFASVGGKLLEPCDCLSLFQFSAGRARVPVELFSFSFKSRPIKQTPAFAAGANRFDQKGPKWAILRKQVVSALGIPTGIRLLLPDCALRVPAAPCFLASCQETRHEPERLPWHTCDGLTQNAASVAGYRYASPATPDGPPKVS